MLLKDKVALVTGAARGIGKSIAGRLVSEGASVALVDIDEQALRKTAAELKTGTIQTGSYACDVADFEQVNRVVEKVVSDFGRLDILVNNAGITRDGLLMRMKPEDWDLVLAVNISAVGYSDHTMFSDDSLFKVHTLSRSQHIRDLPKGSPTV